MSKLEKLISELCPDGVAYVKLGEIANISAGGDLPERYAKGQRSPSEQYPYPIFSNGTEDGALYGFTDTYKIGQEAVTISARGTIGFHAVRAGKFTPIVRLITLIAYDNKITTKFLNYALDVAGISGVSTGIPSLTVPMLEKFTIPLPPLPVQCEIVRILDTFTELTAELTAELTERKKQYDYYRNKLLNFGDDVPMVTLSYCCVSIADGDHQAPQKTENGIPFITISNVSNSNQIDFSDTKFVSESYYNKLDDKRKAQTNDILYTVVGSFGIPVFIDRNMKFSFQRHIAILRPNCEIVVPKYLYHVFQSSPFLKQADTIAVGAAQRTITLAALNRMRIPLPPLNEQARIVSILDKFDALTSSIREGLPAEIELRQKQYEYYRNKLLSFPREEVEA